MFSVRSPLTQEGKNRAPRQKKQPHFIYNTQNYQNAEEIVLSIANGIGIENIDPVLFPRIIGPLYDELRILVQDNNTSAQKEVKNAIDFIQKVQPKRNTQSYSTQQQISDIIYSDFAINKLASAAMNQQKLPTLPPNLKNLVIKHLEEIATTATMQSTQKQAEHAIYSLDPDWKFVPSIQNTPSTNINEVISNEQEAEINLIMKKLEKDLRKLEEEKQIELQRLKDSREAQLTILMKVANDNPHHKNPESEIIHSYKAKEQYYISMKKYKKAEEFRKKINLINQAQQNEIQAKHEKEIETQKKLIEDTYEEKYQIKTRYFKNKANRLKKEADEKINRIKRPPIKECRSSNQRLPSLRTQRRKVNCV